MKTVGIIGAVLVVAAFLAFVPIFGVGMWKMAVAVFTEPDTPFLIRVFFGGVVAAFIGGAMIAIAGVSGAFDD